VVALPLAAETGVVNDN